MPGIVYTKYYLTHGIRLLLITPEMAEIMKDKIKHTTEKEERDQGLDEARESISCSPDSDTKVGRTYVRPTKKSETDGSSDSRRDGIGIRKTTDKIFCPMPSLAPAFALMIVFLLSFAQPVQ